MTILTRLHPYLQWLADQTKPTDAVLRAVQHGSPRPWDEPVPVRGFDSVSLESLGLAPRTQTEVDAAYIQGRGEGVSKGREEGHAAGLAEGERLEREWQTFLDLAESRGVTYCCYDIEEVNPRDGAWMQSCHVRVCQPFTDDPDDPEVGFYADSLHDALVEATACVTQWPKLEAIERGDHRQEAEHE